MHYIKQLKEVKNMSRYVFSLQTDDFKNVFLHGFSDSSKKAYSAVVYLQVESSNGLLSRVITSKTKVAPIKALTIPRLELLACLLLANLMVNVSNTIKDIFSITRKFYWTDSEISLTWIKDSHKEWKSWIENRVNQIRDLTDREDWYFVPGSSNPADILVVLHS